MTTTTYAQRARRLLDVTEPSGIDPECEISEISEESPPAPPALRGPDGGAGFTPLDRATISSNAAKHPLAGIEERLARLTARTAAPDATALDHQLVRDWSVIRAAKREVRNVA
jgi:hypothetical protein